MNVADVIIELSSLPGPSGFEEAVAGRVRELLEPYMSETWVDALGNVIGVRRCGKPDARRLLFDAHIDEVGLVICAVEEGFLRFAKLGNQDDRVLPASRVRMLTDPPLYGVVCAMPPHILKKEDADKVQKAEDMFIEIGRAHV